MASPGLAPQTGRMMINVVDGARRPFSSDKRLLLTVLDGEQKRLVKGYYNGPSVAITDLPVHGSARDSHTVLIHSKGCLQAGFFPVKVRRRAWAPVSLMLVSRQAGFEFARARWDVLKRQGGALFKLLCGGLPDEAEAERLYTELLEQRGECLAALLNITAALASIPLPSGNALEYCRSLLWGKKTILRDRFFGFADKSLIEHIEQAAREGFFAAEPSANLFHPGATRSFKETRFGEANVQITFHEDAPAPAGQVKVECDMDYFSDRVAHALLELLPNLTGRSTDPRRIYALRWMAGKQGGVPDFEPPYVLA